MSRPREGAGRPRYCTSPAAACAAGGARGGMGSAVRVPAAAVRRLFLCAPARTSAPLSRESWPAKKEASPRTAFLGRKTRRLRARSKVRALRPPWKCSWVTRCASSLCAAVDGAASHHCMVAGSCTRPSVPCAARGSPPVCVGEGRRTRRRRTARMRRLPFRKNLSTPLSSRRVPITPRQEAAPQWHSCSLVWPRRRGVGVGG